MPEICSKFFDITRATFIKISFGAAGELINSAAGKAGAAGGPSAAGGALRPHRSGKSANRLLTDILSRVWEKDRSVYVSTP